MLRLEVLFQTIAIHIPEFGNTSFSCSLKQKWQVNNPFRFTNHKLVKCLSKIFSSNDILFAAFCNSFIVKVLLFSIHSLIRVANIEACTEVLIRILSVFANLCSNTIESIILKFWRVPVKQKKKIHVNYLYLKTFRFNIIAILKYYIRIHSEFEKNTKDIHTYVHIYIMIKSEVSSFKAIKNVYYKRNWKMYRKEV